VQATPVLRGKKVLVVDDEHAVRLSMKVLLQSWDCDVRVAEGMEEVQDMLSEEGFALDLLITDYRLRAGLTGGDVIAAVRQKLRTQTSDILPAIIITGDTAPERIRDASSYEATTLLHKPVSTATLQDGMRQIF
jgi:two-component system, sensor histidine kinase